jgi:hypothetical protein
MKAARGRVRTRVEYRLSAANYLGACGGKESISLDAPVRLRLRDERDCREIASTGRSYDKATV